MKGLKQLMYEAYMAGAKAMNCGCYDMPDIEQFNNWYYEIEEKDET